MHPITYLEAVVVGFIQGVTELFPASSLGHNVLLPALIGGSWGANLNVGAANSPYLAFIVGLHVATAIGIGIYFWRDWVRIITGFLTSIRDRDIRTADQKLAWMLIVATFPVGLAGLIFDHEFKRLFAKPVLAAVFLVINGLILYAGERFRTKRSRQADLDIERQRAEQATDRLRERQQVRAGEPAPVGVRVRTGSAHASGQRAARMAEVELAVQADERIARYDFVQALLIGAAQILALLAGISRDGVTMVAGMFRGLSREDAARFAFLLSAPVILAAGAFKFGDLITYGKGMYGPILVGSILSGVAAFISVRFLVRYFRTRTLTPFAIYCVLFGAFCIVYLQVK